MLLCLVNATYGLCHVCVFTCFLGHPPRILNRLAISWLCCTSFATKLPSDKGPSHESIGRCVESSSRGFPVHRGHGQSVTVVDGRTANGPHRVASDEAFRVATKSAPVRLEFAPDGF